MQSIQGLEPWILLISWGKCFLISKGILLFLLESKNMLVLEKNFDHDNDKLDDDDGWMFYQYEISVFPVNETNIEYQRELSKRILDVFRYNGFLAETICDSDFYDE
ncbi:pathogenicity island protein [Pectobacterium parmentieri]|uniref:Pathogenicity island protein n=1 Tax=Pectobacterium parmentieri TaxID=1905730 RepID=A0A0H3IAK9_PECPM|nr:pathogenicity island protein [Pectobacterium parmentieri]